jgi:hypothetical protein
MGVGDADGLAQQVWIENFPFTLLRLTLGLGMRAGSAAKLGEEG